MAAHTTIDSNTPLQFVPGIGPQRAALFERLGLRKAADLLFFFPRTYQDIAPYSTIVEVQDGIRASVVGTIVDMDGRVSFEGRSSVGVLIAVEGGGYLRCVWYNQPFRRQNYTIGMRVVATGVPKSTGISFEMRHPDEFVVLAQGEENPKAKPQPVYHLTEGLQQRHVIKAMEVALENLGDGVEEALPEGIRKEAGELLEATISDKPADQTVQPLMPIQTALHWIHQPDTMEQAQRARLRFIFQELFVLQLAIAMHRHQLRTDRPASRIESTSVIHSRILRRFPFSLTNDQLSVIEDVRRDMASETPMNRLIQGDVGSGKTVIAQYAMLNAVANKFQAALMAPTELLARQHFQKLTKQLEGSQVLVELLVGSISQRDRNELLQRIGIGTVDIVVGTQSLLNENVAFANLGLVVIDEQHRFGVRQRAALRDARTVPHYLVMTATPIPRTLSMTLFGELDVSSLRERPPGHATIHTYVATMDQQERWWKFLIEQVGAGRQAYIVTPRVESGENDEALGAEQVFETLRNGPLAKLRLDLLHGRMDGSEKQAKLDDFQSGKTQVLVATTVVEVGIDVPNATVMTILDADRLGLAQLHQLRGRVGRGRFQGFVCVFPRNGVTPDDNERLRVFSQVDDGFKLAEQDFKLRGPGDILGTRQAGMPPLRIADLVRDEIVVQAARKIARQLIEADPKLELPDHAKLRRQVFAKHGAMLEVSDVG